jgi:signal transduction histidine kinase
VDLPFRDDWCMSFIKSRSWTFVIPLLLIAQAAVRDSYGWLTFVLPISCVFLLMPPLVARWFLPFLALFLAAVDFLDLRAYLDLRGPVHYVAGPVPIVPWPDTMLMPAVGAFAVIGGWLFFHLDAPGSAWLVAASGRVRERAGASFWPALAVIPTQAIGYELYSALGRPGPVPALTVVLAMAVVAMSLLVILNPKPAGFLAVMVLPLMGIGGIQIARQWPDASVFRLYGVVLVDDRGTAIAAGVQGGILLLADVWLGWKFLQGLVEWGREATRKVELTRRVETLTRTRADVVDSAAAELRRIERDLHDGAQARLVALGMNLRVAERVLKTDPDTALGLVSEARDTSSRALTELRSLVRGIYPPVLADRGLADAVRALALDTPLPAVVDIDLPGRPDLPVASAVYFSVAEALANVAKHAAATRVRIQVGYERGILRAQVTDDGVGGADPAQGTGLRGVERRLAAFDGILAVSSPAGGPTIVVIEVPCALS